MWEWLKVCVPAADLKYKVLLGPILLSVRGKEKTGTTIVNLECTEIIFKHVLECTKK